MTMSVSRGCPCGHRAAVVRSRRARRSGARAAARRPAARRMHRMPWRRGYWAARTVSRCRPTAPTATAVERLRIDVHRRY
ncbi:hypothetical protein DPR00_36830 [Burkholderia pseudomallei]|nr:hypothetical protein CF641_10080 [Burkholderia pseudomallei]PNX43364.1 hypothetical protein CF642_09715 [Burkholderia pseudomallei]RAQ01728.1 hypothetical protein DPQ98_30810 [Burkholderia pseudomallei]RAQ06241.1 hypothetical protein DPR00_36830 [Burkholderia pseudomallei]TOY77223.1 hypothetical protein DIJ62_35690 [Burkholderia pseudomallei]